MCYLFWSVRFLFDFLDFQFFSRRRKEYTQMHTNTNTRKHTYTILNTKLHLWTELEIAFERDAYDVPTNQKMRNESVKENVQKPRYGGMKNEIIF